MTKIISYLFVLVTILLIGHDVYLYTKSPEKGVRVSDVGALWDQYHKESHDQWRKTVRTIEETVEQTVDEVSKEAAKTAKQLTNEQSQEELENADDGILLPIPDYAQEFKQTNEKGKAAQVVDVVEEKESVSEPGQLQRGFGFILEQKAALISALLALLFWTLHIVSARLFREKTSMDKVEQFKRKKRKDGSYSYSRK